MVDVTITTIVHAIKDSKGSPITDVVLKPTKSERRTTTTTTTTLSEIQRTSSETQKLAVGVQAGIDVAAGVAALSLALAIGLPL